jgi:hypothetical protein
LLEEREATEGPFPVAYHFLPSLHFIRNVLSSSVSSSHAECLPHHSQSQV